MSHTRDGRWFIPRAIAIAAAVTVGCATGLSPTDAGAFSDGGEDGAGDAGDAGDTGVVSPTTCIGARVCDGNTVRACRDGKPAEDIEPCPDSCSLGRCVSGDCTAAEIERTSFIGCLFYAFQPENVDSDADRVTSFLVTNPRSTATEAVIERPKPGMPGEWAITQYATIGPGESARLPASLSEVVDPGLWPATAFRVRSDGPVSVAVIHSDDSDPTHTLSSGGTMVWPVQSLGSRYLAMTYPQSAAGGVADTAGGRGGAGRIAIVGTQPGTHVQVSTAAAYDSGGSPLDDIELSDGDVFQVYSAADGADLSGTEILADLPVAVFAGNMTTAYGRSATGVYSPDMTHEQLPPSGAWGRSYVAAALPPQANVCDTLLGIHGASLWRILAAKDGTEVRLDPPNRVDLPPSPKILNAGEVWEFVATGSFAVTSTNSPILVSQGIDCEPTLSFGVATDHLLSDFAFAILPGFDQTVAVARQVGAAVFLDGEVIPPSQFVRAGTSYEVAQISLPMCTDSAFVCTHRLTSTTASFGATIRGMDALSSYALTVPTFRGCTDPDCIR